MPKRIELILKLLCLALGVALLAQVGFAVHRHHPLAAVTMPVVPTLAGDTNAVAAPNLEAMKKPAKAQTNSAPGTNGLANLAATNTVLPTNMPPPVIAVSGTNSAGPMNELAPTNRLVPGGNATNPPAPTNVAGATNGGMTGANSVAAADHKKRPSHSRPPMLGGGGFFPGMGGPAKPLPELAPVDQARVEKIVASEFLGRLVHPQPKALLGIAGDTAFLRSDSGQTGIAKVGESVGDLKVVRIGINRVLVEQNGEKVELMIFDGMGGESLLTASDTNSNENSKK